MCYASCQGSRERLMWNFVPRIKFSSTGFKLKYAMDIEETNLEKIRKHTTHLFSFENCAKRLVTQKNLVSSFTNTHCNKWFKSKVNNWKLPHLFPFLHLYRKWGGKNLRVYGPLSVLSKLKKVFQRITAPFGLFVKQYPTLGILFRIHY